MIHPNNNMSITLIYKAIEGNVKEFKEYKVPCFLKDIQHMINAAILRHGDIHDIRINIGMENEKENS